MASALGDVRRLKELYRACLEVKSAIPHPRIMGVIRECGGKMWMGERTSPHAIILSHLSSLSSSSLFLGPRRSTPFLGALTSRISLRCLIGNWAQASTDFFESFKQFDEAGAPQRVQVLKYLVLAYMLMGSDINPFDSQETKPCVRLSEDYVLLCRLVAREAHLLPRPIMLTFRFLQTFACLLSGGAADRYKNSPEIVAMTNLVGAYQRRDIHDAQKILRGAPVSVALLVRLS